MQSALQEEHADLMIEILFHGFLEDGTTIFLQGNDFHVNKFNLEGGIFRPFQRSDGSHILYILEDGKGTKYPSKKGIGQSVLGLIWGKRWQFGFKNPDEVYNICHSNCQTKKQRNLDKK